MYKIGDFKGKMLLSMPQINSRVFRKSVIYVHTDDMTGSLGFIANFPMEQQQAETWSKEIGWHWPEKIYHGGPVDSHMGFIVHSNDYAQTSTIRMNDSISYTAGKSVLTDLNRGIGPADFALVVGYCGWAPGQLLEEVARGDWRVADYNDDYFFQPYEKTKSWENAVHLDAENIVKKLIDPVDTN